MTRRPTRRILVLSAVALVAATAAGRADSPSDRGKKKLPRLFAEAVSAAAESTVRVQCDGRDAALGTVVASDGYVLTKGSELYTAKGVVRKGITCSLKDGSVYDAVVVGYHKPTDLALLKIDADGLRPVKFAPVDDGEVGNWVAVPGVGAEPIAVGVVSAGPRKLYGQEGEIHNGNKGTLGIRLDQVKDQDGVLVVKVEPDTAASRAGLRPRDVIYELAGKAVKSPEALIELMEGYLPGDTVTVRVRRGEAEVSLRVKLGSRADIDRSAMQNNMGGSLSARRTGFPAVVQHDTVLRPADCGGPLVDLDGHVIGVNIARAGRVETWALPGTVVKPIIKELRDGKLAPVSK